MLYIGALVEKATILLLFGERQLDCVLPVLGSKGVLFVALGVRMSTRGGRFVIFPPS